MSTECHHSRGHDPAVQWQFETRAATIAVARLTIEHEIHRATGDEPVAEDVALATTLLLEGVPLATDVELTLWCRQDAVDLRLALDAEDVAVDPDVEGLVGEVAVDAEGEHVAVEVCCAVRAAARPRPGRTGNDLTGPPVE